MKIKQIILLGTLALLLCAALLIFYKGESWAEKKLRTKIGEIEHLSFDSLEINMPDRELSFRGLSYTKEAISIKTDFLKIEGIKIIQFLMKGKLSIDSVIFSNPKVSINEGYVNDSLNSENQIEKELPFQFIVETLYVKNGQFDIRKSARDSSFLKCSFDIILDKIQSDKVKNARSLLENLKNAKLTSLSYNAPDGFYVVKSADLEYIQQEKRFTIHSFTVKSLYKKYELGPEIGHEKDWMDLEIDSLAIDFESIDKLVDEKIVKAINVYQARLEVFRDKRLPFPENNRPKLFKEILAIESLSFGVDSLRLINGNIIYQEFVKQSVGPGEITLNNVQATFSDLYSYNKKPERAPRLRGKFKIMNAAQVYTDVSFPKNQNGKTIIKGKMEAMDLTKFNKMLEYVAFLKVKTGKVQGCDFQMSYDRKISHGEMMLTYDDLKIEFIQKDNTTRSGIVQGIETFVANTFVVHENNKQDKSFRVGRIEYERDEQKSMFNF